MSGARDIEKMYSNEKLVEKPRRLADCTKADGLPGIRVAGDGVYVPVRTTSSVESERGAEDVK